MWNYAKLRTDNKLKNVVIRARSSPPAIARHVRTTLTDTGNVQSGKSEVDVATIPILTTDSHPLGRIVKVHGVVSASSVRNKNILVDAYVALKGIFGGSAPLYEDLVNEAYVSAANGLAEAAHSIGATHVIQVRFERPSLLRDL